MMFDDNELVTDDDSVFQDKRFVDAIFKRADESIEQQKRMNEMVSLDVCDCEGGELVRYVGASDAQVNWGGCDDPREILVEGDLFLLEDVEVHSWHTKVKLKGIEGRFNSVCFEHVPD